MGWIRDGAHDHEGWVANVLADGRVARSSTGGGVIVHELTVDDIAAGREVRRYPGSEYLDVVVPWDQVVSWRVTCQCGWTGVQLPAYDDAEYGTRDCPEDVEERVFLPSWHAHVAPYVVLLELEEMTDQLHDLEKRIAHTVEAARAAGASWRQVRRAAHLSERSTVHRWDTSHP